MRKSLKKNENDGAPDGFATLADTPGMGDVRMPTSTSTGSGDVFGGVLDFSTWTKSRRKKRGRKKSRRRRA